jgi:hypothetical protein
MAGADPCVARLISHSQVNHIVPSTRSGYDSALRDYTDFCRVRGIDPWPVDEVKMVGWMLILAQRIKSTSLRKYMSALPYGQAIQPVVYPWSLKGSDAVRRALRFIRHRYPCSDKASKMPISLSLIHTLAQTLPGWPCLAALEFDDLLWLTASVIGTSAFLRGGEFLASPSSDRAILPLSALSYRTINDVRVLIVAPPQPKTRMDLVEVCIPCFAPPSAGPLLPATLFDTLCSRSPIVGTRSPELVPAFHRIDGAPLSRDYMVRRTIALLVKAKIDILDPAGLPTQILASSWRAGGVRSALDARLSESVIMELGRWRSSAWRHYLLLSPLDLQGACRRMWDVSAVGDVREVVLQGGRAFASNRSMQLSDLQAVKHAKAQLSAIIAAKSSDPAVCLAQTTSAFAMVDATVSLLKSSSAALM